MTAFPVDGIGAVLTIKIYVQDSRHIAA